MPAVIGHPAQLRSPQSGSTALPSRRARRLHQWLYMWHPKRWHFYQDAGDRGEWLPRLGRIMLDAGQNNVLENGNITLAIASAQERGWTIIRPTDERLGDFAGYMLEVPTDTGRKAYVSRWKQYSVEGGIVFEDFDRSGYYAFLRHLVGSGVVPAMSPNINRFHLRQFAKRLERAESTAANNPHNAMLQSRAKRLRERYEAMSYTPTKKKPGRPKKPRAEVEA